MTTIDADETLISSDHTPPHPPPAAAPAGLDASVVHPLSRPLSPPFPRPAVPATAVLSLGAFGRHGGPPVPSVLDAGAIVYVTSGRIAIALALRQMGVGPGDSVLVPSYHTPSQIEPIVWAGATPVFYRIHADTTVDLADVAAKLDAGAKVLMAVNYFGFPQPLDTLRAFCDARGLLLLEDCAHCFLGHYKGRPVGSYGDYAIASSMKFFPIYEGGALISARHALAGIALASNGAGFEAKAALGALEAGFGYGRLGLLKALLWLPTRIKDVVWGALKARRTRPAAALAPDSSHGFGFEPAWLDKRSSAFSRLTMRAVSLRRMGARRRANYRRLQAALAGLPGCRPLHPALPEGVYPWVFPLVFEQPQALFERLKRAGVPVVRFGEYQWPGVDAGVCAVSADYARRVLQFPIHQELRDSELAWMINQIKEALLSGSAPTP